MHLDIFKNIAGELGRQVAADDRIKNTVIYIIELFERNGLNAVEVSVVTELLNSRSKELLKGLLSSKSECKKEIEIKDPVTKEYAYNIECEPNEAVFAPQRAVTKKRGRPAKKKK